MKILRIALCMLLLAAMVFSVFGCGQAAQTSDKKTETAVEQKTETKAETKAEKKQITIGFNNMFPDIEFFQVVEKGLEEACKANCIRLVKAYAQRDPAKMVSNVDSFVLQGADIIVEFNVNPEVGNTITKKMAEKKIPVIGVDCYYDGAYFWGVNNQKVGTTAGEYAAEYIKKNWDGKIDLMANIYSEGAGPDVKKRNSGAVDAIMKAYPNITKDKIFWLPGPNDKIDAINSKAQFTDFLTAHPDAKHIYLHVLTDQGAVGALSALEATGRTGQCIITSCDAGQEAIDNVKKDKPTAWLGSVAAFPEKYGENIVKYALDILDGKNPPKERFTDNLVIDRNNVKQIYPNK